MENSLTISEHLHAIANRQFPTRMEDAVVLADSVFGTTYGKTANGLVRFSRRFKIRSVIDNRLTGQDAGRVLSGKKTGIPIVSTLDDAAEYGGNTMVVGVATDGGVLPPVYRGFISDALSRGMNIVSGLHEYISDDPEFAEIAVRSGSRITDVRKLFREKRDSFTGDIVKVLSKKIAVLGTDSAVGKRTTSVFLSDTMERMGLRSMMIGTGQTSWMQGFKYTVVLDALVNDFVAGGLEKVAVDAWNDLSPEFMYLEGQGSVLHPAYPGSFEIIGALHPDAIILQHSPTRVDYDGFPGFKIPPVEKYIRILELLSDRKVIAISINREDMTDEEVHQYSEEVERKFGFPAFDPLGDLRETARYVRDCVDDVRF